MLFVEKKTKSRVKNNFVHNFCIFFCGQFFSFFFSKTLFFTTKKFFFWNFVFSKNTIFHDQKYFCFKKQKEIPTNEKLWSWKLGFWGKNHYWNMCKFVINRQNETKITELKSSSKINLNPYPKCYHGVNSLGTMLVWTTTIFSNP